MFFHWVSPAESKVDRASGLGANVSNHCALRSEHPEAGGSLLVLVVGASDGVVRILRGPKRRHCGSFVSLADGTAQSIFELLGYRPSQVKNTVCRWHPASTTLVRTGGSIPLENSKIMI